MKVTSDHPSITNYNMKDLISEYLLFIGPILVQFLALSLVTLLALYEIKMKLEARALQILLHKNKYSTRRVLAVNFGQILCYTTAVYFRLCSPEMQAIAAYSLAAKLIQTNRQQLKVDILTIAPTALFAFIVKPNNSISSIEFLDELFLDLTQQVIPLILSYLTILFYPIITVTIISLYIAFVFFRFLVNVRRSFPDDFDFFLTLTISLLAFKTVKRDLVQRQFKDMMCSKLQLPTLADSSSGNPGSAMSPLSTYYGNHELGAESHAQRALYHWCQSQDNVLRSITKTIQNGDTLYGEVEEVKKPANMSYLDFYTEIFTQYRGYHILASQQGSKSGSCTLQIAHPPRDSGLYGMMRGAAYKMYILASWVLPESYQDYLSIFGFRESTIEIETGMNCSRLNKQMLVERITEF
eukprot:TRINITY_DN4968_c0_g1_i6.p1 TRINITY_DN4968_c0_g1~~TRINITY_DN4968_c0_g1_i6.p1  ORF type:complete len:411 (-),score=65.72 TRINITY_DN4968_c0_g1_i6:941-2173(-)